MKVKQLMKFMKKKTTKAAIKITKKNNKEIKKNYGFTKFPIRFK